MATLLSTLVGGSGSSGSDDDAREFKNFAVYAGMWHSWPQSAMDFSSSYIDGYTNDSLSGAYESRFLTSSHTLTIPSGVTKVRITCIGAGGGGGTRAGQHYNAGGGGGGGAFAMGEFNVSAGEQLLVNPGKSGRATQYNYQANGGTTTCIGTGTLTTNEISVSANGGTGGSQSSPGSGATTKSVSGSRLISGTNVTANGGAGGSGSTASFGFGPEGYGAGGGGAAGFVLGNGGSGSNMSNNGGYSSFGGGGGAVGGYSGGSWPFGQASTNNQDYWAPAGAGAGQNGENGSSQSTATKGGNGRFGTLGGQKQAKYGSYHLDADREGANSPGQNLVASNSGGSGAAPTGVDQYLSSKQSTSSFVTFPKSFAYGPLAVAYSSGGGGGNGYSSYPYSHPGGHAGPGAGGGGGAAYNQNPYGAHVGDNGNTRFDLSKGQFCDYHQNVNFAYGSWGGNAGILGGGGGGGGYFGDGGCAGFGGGGGGAGGHYNSGHHGYGGYGGSGLVLIEWA